MADAKDLMEKGWQARENYEFDLAEKLLNQAQGEFERVGDWYNVVECLNHLAYLRKTQAFLLSQEAIELAQEALALAEKKQVKTALANRANASVLKYAGEYEQAEEYIRAVIAGMPSKPADQAEMRGDLAYILMRRGELEEAAREIETARKDLEEHLAEVGLPHRMIWKTKLLMVASRIKYNLGETVEAKQLAKEALTLAQENGLKMRTAEAETLLKLFDERD